ncbi:MAG: cytochrome c oxidase subunit II [Alphaproteobacteria bacterium]|nr:cytochrome c oxidase subunit II [Alphaproteobacteria bacterium]
MLYRTYIKALGVPIVGNFVWKSLIIFLLFCPQVYADQPLPWQIGFQKAVTPVMERINDLHNWVLVIVSGIGVFVLGMLGWIILRFRAVKNPQPSQHTHNPFLEMIWTIIPVFMLLIIAVPSFKLMFYMDKAVNPEMEIRVTGNTWYWKYEYPEHQLSFDSQIVSDQNLKKDQLRLLEVDNQIVVPINTTVRLLFTSSDVLHSWTVPAFGVKKDCIPGRHNEAWINVSREGTYYGQCSELCGMKHGFMPISVRAVSKKAFQEWLKGAKQKFA